MNFLKRVLFEVAYAISEASFWVTLKLDPEETRNRNQAKRVKATERRIMVQEKYAAHLRRQGASEVEVERSIEAIKNSMGG